jgi:hypothetical protein
MLQFIAAVAVKLVLGLNKKYPDCVRSLVPATGLSECTRLFFFLLVLNHQDPSASTESGAIIASKQ